jgi:putative glycosyl hydrolase-like family 15 (GHL15) protein
MVGPRAPSFVTTSHHRPMSDPRQPDEPIRRRRGARRPLPFFLVALVAALALGGVWFLRSPRVTDDRSGGAPVQVTHSPVTPMPTAAPTLASIGRRYRYIWTGTPGRRFTRRESRALAHRDSLIVLEKGYGNSFGDEDAAARRLVSLDPHVQVLVDFLAGALPPVLAERWGSSFKARWLLRDANGDPIGDCSGGRCSYRVDVADPGYRRFLIGQVLDRLRAAPYAGVMYDNLHYYDHRQYPELSAGAIRRLNSGFRLLLRETRHALGPDETVFFNGVSRNIGHVDVADRGFDLLATATGAQDETYCYLDNQNRFRGSRALIADDRRYYLLAARGSTVLESVHLESAAAHADAPHIERYCFAHYLMSMVPGMTFVQFKAFADLGQGPQIRWNAVPEQALDLGPPVRPFERRGTVLRRPFEHGWVVVNAGTSPATISLPANVTVWEAGARGARLGRGEPYTIPPRDAAYFLSASG